MNLEELYKRIDTSERLTGGLIHNVYKVNYKDKIYTVKIINKQFEDRIERLETSEEISNICYDNGLNVAHALKINGKYINKVNDRYMLVCDYIEGDTISTTDINDNHVKKVASLVGKLHSVNYTDNYHKIVRHKIEWSKFINNIDFNLMPYKDIYLDNYKSFYDIFDKVIRCKNNLEPNLGICHRDIKPSNVVWNNDEPYLIDFEGSRVDDIKLDFIEAMLRWCGLLDLNINYDRVKLFVNEYKKYIDISDIDYEELLYANLLGRFDFLYYNLDVTLVDKIGDIEEAKDQVVVMINEINYYINEIDNLVKFLYNINS